MQATTENTEGLKLLESYAEKAANSVSHHLKRASLEDYIHFLNYMYHYTRFSEHNLMLASQASQTEELREYFKHMAKEERGHYLLAVRDLEGFGLNVTDQTPAVVEAINQLWESLKDQKTANGYLGIIFVFENVVKYVGDDIKDLLRRLNLGKKQCRWLSVHAEADLEHGAEATEMADKHFSNNPALLVESAKKATELWVELMAEAFQAPQSVTKKAS